MFFVIQIPIEQITVLIQISNRIRRLQRIRNVLLISPALRPAFEESKEITVQRLKAAGADDLEKDEICIIRTDWDSFWNKQEYVSESPYITVSAAEYLVSKGIKLVGMDSPMIGDPNDGISSVGADLVLPDYKFSEAGIPIVLGLVNLSSLPEKFFFTAFPLKLHNGEGSPCRATAIIF